MKLGPNRKGVEGERDAAGTVEAEGAAGMAVVVAIAEGAAADKAEAEGAIVSRKWRDGEKGAIGSRLFSLGALRPGRFQAGGPWALPRAPLRPERFAFSVRLSSVQLR